MDKGKGAAKKVGIPTKSGAKKAAPKGEPNFGPGGSKRPRGGGKVAGVGRGSNPPPSKG